MEILIGYTDNGIKKYELFGLNRDVEPLSMIDYIIQHKIVKHGYKPYTIALTSELAKCMVNTEFTYKGKRLKKYVVNDFDGIEEWATAQKMMSKYGGTMAEMVGE